MILSPTPHNVRRTSVFQTHRSVQLWHGCFGNPTRKVLEPRHQLRVSEQARAVQHPRSS